MSKNARHDAAREQGRAMQQLMFAQTAGPCRPVNDSELTKPPFPSEQVDTDGGDDEVMVPVDEPPSSQSLELPRARADGGGLPECRRGEHTTSAEVTRGGHKGCTRRVRAHAVDKDDALGCRPATHSPPIVPLNLPTGAQARFGNTSQFRPLDLL